MGEGWDGGENDTFLHSFSYIELTLNRDMSGVEEQESVSIWLPLVWILLFILFWFGGRMDLCFASQAE